MRIRTTLVAALTGLLTAAAIAGCGGGERLRSRRADDVRHARREPGGRHPRQPGLRRVRAGRRAGSR